MQRAPGTTCLRMKRARGADSEASASQSLEGRAGIRKTTQCGAATLILLRVSCLPRRVSSFGLVEQRSAGAESPGPEPPTMLHADTRSIEAWHARKPGSAVADPLAQHHPHRDPQLRQTTPGHSTHRAIPSVSTPKSLGLEEDMTGLFSWLVR